MIPIEVSDIYIYSLFAPGSVPEQERPFLLCAFINVFSQFLPVCRSHSVGGLGRIWNNSCSQNRLQEPRGRHRLSTVIQPLRQNAGEVVDLTVDEDGKGKLSSMHRNGVHFLFSISFFKSNTHFPPIFKLSAKHSADMFCNCYFCFFCVSCTNF